MENLELYNKFKLCPKEAQKDIAGGKLKGKTDINPMWRIKVLTEQFGACGTGWKAPITEKWTEIGANGEVACFVRVNLFYKVNGEWSEPVEGIGGSCLINLEKGQPVTNDEGFKMAYTDAISVACKMLGVAADIYWKEDRTKYERETHAKEEPSDGVVICDSCGAKIKGMIRGDETFTAETVKKNLGGLCISCYKSKNENRGDNQNGKTE